MTPVSFADDSFQARDDREFSSRAQKFSSREKIFSSRENYFSSRADLVPLIVSANAEEKEAET